MGLFSFLTKKKENKEDLDKGLEKTKESVFSRISKAIVGKSTVDDEVLDNLEEILITSDVGVDTTLKIIDRIQARVARDKYVGTNELNTILKEEIMGLLQENESGDGTTFDIPADKKPYVIMVVGVNGVGKTTTIGKLANLHTISRMRARRLCSVLPTPSVLLPSASSRFGLRGWECPSSSKVKVRIQLPWLSTQ